MAADTDSQSGDEGRLSTVMRVAAAAAATGAAAYGARRLRGNREGEPEADEPQEDERSEPSSKREELSQALTSRVADVKRTASKLKPGEGGRRSTLDTAWAAASGHLLPVAGEAASSLGASIAKKAPEIV